jgi:capsular polysaccharide export protein
LSNLDLSICFFENADGMPLRPNIERREVRFIATRLRLTHSPDGFLRIPPFHRSVPMLARPRSGRAACLPVTEQVDLAARIVRDRVGGCFWGAMPTQRRPVLVTLGRTRSARIVLERVLAAHAAADIMVAPGPGRHDVGARARRRGAGVVRPETDPHALLDGVTCVYAAEMDDIARLAVLRSIRVILFDRGGRPVEPGRAEIVAEIVEQTAYVDPFLGSPMACADAIALLAEWRRLIEANRQVGVCLGMSRWKRPRMADFLATVPGHPPFRFDLPIMKGAGQHAGQHRAVAVWATRQPPGLEERARAAKMPLWRIEDGFIRSIGLGSALMPPCSITVDSRGVYYDPARESDLEHILATATFDDALRRRAAKLMNSLIQRGISKYGPGQRSAAAEPWACAGRRTILVPGQVADDQSVRRGGGRISGNLELLQAVRTGNPDAFIVYRPHPDVEASYRVGHLGDSVVLAMADHIDRGPGITETIARVDEIHTLTSLAGFEALMRGRRVVTYGVPFYAGWGLTTDLGDVPARRGRVLSVEDLAAGVLILFPRYLDPVTRLPCGPEILVERLQDASLWKPTWWMRALAVQTLWRNGVRRSGVAGGRGTG